MMGLLWGVGLLLAQDVAVDAPPDPCATGDVVGCEARCEGGDAVACSTTGYFVEIGAGVPKDPARAAVLYKQGCAGGDGRGCGNLGVLLDLGSGVERDVSQALVQYRRGCRVGDGASCLNLGIHQATGEGVGLDLAQALKNYGQACELGEPRGCNLLGAARESSAPDQSVALYSQACEGGHGPGCYNLARMVVAGHARLDIAGVVQLYVAACDGGEAAACLDLGVHLLSGNGIAKDEALAARHFQNTCEAGLPKGCSLRGALYLNAGQDAPGFALLEHGCAGGDAWGCKVLTELRAEEEGR